VAIRMNPVHRVLLVSSRDGTVREVARAEKKAEAEEAARAESQRVLAQTGALGGTLSPGVPGGRCIRRSSSP
jgi:hypothetical protein